MGRVARAGCEMLVMVGQGPVGVLVRGGREVGGDAYASAVPVSRKRKRSLANLVGPLGGPKWIGADLVLMCVRGIALS